MLCFSAKWLGEKTILFYSEWEHGIEGMLKAAADLFEEADILVTYNGEKFDYPHFITEFLIHDIAPPPPPSHVDLYKFVRNKTRFFSNKLEHISSELGLGSKVEHEGFALWKKVMKGEEAARNRMQRYCIRDCALTERVYKKLRPFITNHPNIGHGHNCPKCGSAKVHKRGERKTAHYAVQRYRCQKCGGWHEGTRRKIT